MPQKIFILVDKFQFGINWNSGELYINVPDNAANILVESGIAMTEREVKRALSSPTRLFEREKRKISES